MHPFEALYDIKPPQLALGPYQQTNVVAVEELVQERHQMDLLLKGYLGQARVSMKFYADHT